MPIEDAFTITGRGTVVTGRVQRGVLAKNTKIEIVGLHESNARSREIVVTNVQSFHKDVPEARAGENVALLLRGVDRDEVVRGQVVTVPGVVKPHAHGEAELFVLAADEGGRRTPFGTGYAPQFFFGCTDVTGSVEVPVETSAEGLIRPGEHARVIFHLQHAVALEEGMRFALREGGRTIGAGVVTRVIA
jgi:elongation factor Tu